MKLCQIIPPNFTGLTSTIITPQTVGAEDELKCKAIRLHLKGFVSEAEILYRELIKEGASDPRVYANLAAIEFTKNNIYEARDLLLTSHNLRSRPCYGSYMISLLSLRLSDYKTAWRYYEYRWLNSFIPKINHWLPVIDDDRDWNRKDVVLSEDGGLGDHVFCLHLIRGCGIFLEGDFSGSKNACDLVTMIYPTLSVSQGGLHRELSAWLPFQSLIRLLDDIEISFDVGRLDLLTYSRKISRSKPKVGLHWQGNSLNELFLVPASRSLNASIFTSLIESELYKIYTLQVGTAANQIDQFKESCIEMQAHRSHKRFTIGDLIATIKQLDLVVCGDSLIANLAGYLGKPTLLLLSSYHDWRWVKRRDCNYSFWYPSVKILDCVSLEDSVEIREELARIVKDMLDAN
jgi:hypothetical protein